MSGTPSKAETKLMSFMMGWRTGAKGGFAGLAPNPDLLKGHEAGRKAAGEAYRLASQEYGAVLSPLRGESNP